MRLPPHKFPINGKTWRLRYGDPGGDILDHDKDFGACVAAERLVYLAPELRLKRNRETAWLIFAHEYLHGKYPSMRHSRIAQLEKVLGEVLAELLGGEGGPRRTTRAVRS